MRHSRKSLVVFILVTFMAVPFTTQAAKIELQGGVFGGTLYQLSYALSEIMKKYNPDIQLTLSETSGTAAGIIKASQAPSQRLIGGSTTSMQEAVNGVTPYPKKFVTLKIVANMAENVNFMIATDPKLNTLATLSGKRLGFGPHLNSIGHNHWSIVSRSIPGSERMKPSFMNWSSLQGALLDGGLDAIVMAASVRQSGNWPPVPIYQEIAISRGTPSFISLDKDAIDAASKKDGMIYPACVMPKGIIAPDAPPRDILGWIDGLGVLAFEEFPEELAYQIVKTLHEKCGEMGATSAAARGIWPELVVTFKLPDEMIHPGTLRYLKEIGRR